jgi:hypothetical protein
MAEQQIQVNVDYLKTTRVHICMPCYGGQLTEQTFMSFIKWANTCRQLGIDWTVETMTNESLISRARNTLTAKFLANEGSTHLMFIDADIGWEPWHLLVLLNAQKDVVGGLYPMKSLPVKWCVNGIPGKEEGPGPLIEVTKTGTGFLLIKREVFEKLNAHPAVRHFNNDIGLPKELDVNMKTYFDTAVREGRYYSEDWTFCENWRDLGGEVWVDKRVLLRHTGTYVFDYATHEPLFKELRAMFDPEAAKAAAEKEAAAKAAKDAAAAAPDDFGTPHAIAAAAQEAATDVAPKVIASSKKPAKKKKAAATA